MSNFPTSVSTDANLFVAVTDLQTTLASTITDIVTTIPLTSTSGFPTTGYVTIDNSEVVKYTGISGADLTGCTRGADGTSALPHSTGVTVGLTVVAAHHNLLKDEVIAIETALGAGFTKGNLTAATAKIAVTGGTNAVIGSGATVDLGSVNIDDLADVVTTAPSVDQVLKFNGTQWVNGPGTTSSAAIGIDFFADDASILAKTPTNTNNANQVESLLKVPRTAAEQAEVVEPFTTTTNPVFGEGYLYNVDLGRTKLDAGAWSFDTYCSVNTNTNNSPSLDRNIYQVLSGTGTLSTVRSGTSATATQTVTTGIFASGDATADISTCGYLQTPQGLYEITGYTSAKIVTITVLATYTDETNVPAGTWRLWRKLFGINTGNIPYLNTTYGLITTNSVQGEYTLTANGTDRFGEIAFARSTSATKVINFVHNGAVRASFFETPLITMHNNLAGLQGGSATERYHLSAAGATAAEALVSSPVLPLAGGTMTGDITMSNNKAVILKETTGNGTDSVTLKAPASVTTSYTLQLPPVLGAAGSVLTDAAGNGVLTMAVPSGTGTVNAGTAGRLALYPTSATTVDDVYTQNSQGIDILVEAQGSRSAALELTIPNPGNAVTAGNFIVDSDTNARTIVGTKTFSGQLIGKGTATNDSTAAGYIGEYADSTVGNTSVPTSSQYGDLTSISLTAGDWDIWILGFLTSAGATWSEAIVGLGTVTGNDGTGLSAGSTQAQFNHAASSTTVTELSLTMPPIRISLASTTTKYLKMLLTYTGGAALFKGRISARRVR